MVLKKGVQHTVTVDNAWEPLKKLLQMFCFVCEESKCQFRNLTEHLRHCEEVEIRGTEVSWLNGVNHRSDLQYFDLCNGALLADVMYDVLAFFGSRS